MRALHMGCSERPCSPVVATQLAEPGRKPTNRAFQYPLKLWPDDPAKPPTSSWFEVIEGELHYLPPPCERPRLARQFLLVHAAFPHEADTPSVAQLRNLPGIVALARDVPLEHAMAQRSGTMPKQNRSRVGHKMLDEQTSENLSGMIVALQRRDATIAREPAADRIRLHTCKGGDRAQHQKTST